MENKKFLNEETYQKNKKKIQKIGIIAIIVCVLLGGGLLILGNSKYSEKNVSKLEKQIEEKKQELITLKEGIETKIEPTKTEIKKLNRLNRTDFETEEEYYEVRDKISKLVKSIEDDEEKIEIIEDATEDNGNCSTLSLDEDLTEEFCSLKSDFTRLKSGFGKGTGIASFLGTALLMLCIPIAIMVFFLTKGREISAYTVQQQMPIAKEGIEEMAPTMGKAAKEITKGIKDGLKDEEK